MPSKRLRLLPEAPPSIAVILVLLSFFAFWNWDLGYPSFSGDESFVAILTSKPVGEILQQLNLDEPHPPVYFLVLRAWRDVIGRGDEFSMRYPSVLAGLLLLSITFRIGRELGLHWPAALIAALALGLNPQVTVHIREARMYGLMLTSLAFAVLIGLRFEQLPGWMGVWLAAMVFLFALLTHYFNILFIAALGVWGYFVMTGHQRRRWVIAQAATWGVLAVWLPLMGRGFFNPTSLTTGKTWSFTLPPWDALARLIRTGLFGYRDIPEMWLVSIGSVLLIGIWLVGSWAAQGRRRWLMVTGLAAPLLVYVLLTWSKPVFHPKYMLPWLLFAALSSGSLMARWRAWGRVACIALVALAAFPTWQAVRRPYDTGIPGVVISPQTWLRPIPREIMQHVVQYSGPTDIYGLGTPDLTHYYYANLYFERSLGLALIPEYPTQSEDELSNQINALLQKHDVLWYLDYYDSAWDPDRIADKAFAYSALSAGTEEVAESRLRLYTSAKTILRDQQLVGAHIGNVAELEGVWVRRGQNLHMVIVWRALTDRPMISAKVFVHLIDRDGQLVAQDDSIPVGWTRPLDTWRIGERLLDAHTLTLPADARNADLSLRIGLYDPDVMTRLAAYDSTGRRLDGDAVSVPLVRWMPFTTREDP